MSHVSFIIFKFTIQRKFHNGGDDWLQKAEVKVPFKRLTKPIDVARAAAFFCSKESGLATKDLLKLFGPKRIIDTPISEAAIVGASMGAALTGLRPIAELMYVDFFGMSMDQIANQLAKVRYMFGGQINAPMILRAQGGTGRSAGAQHSQSLETWIMHTPGLYLSIPYTPNDAYHLLRAALKINNPTIFIEHKLLYNTSGVLDKNNPDQIFGKAKIRKKGKDLSIISYSRMVNFAEKAAEELAKQKIDVEVVDLRTLNPLDRETIIESVNKTKRALVLSESCYTAGVPSEITSIIFEHCYKNLLKPVIRYTAEDELESLGWDIIY